MTKRRLLLVCALLPLLLAQAALAAPYSFPDAYVRLEARDEWVLLTPESLDASQAARMGLDIEALRADYAIQHVLFEVFLPSGESVRLTVAETEQTLAWGSAEDMSEANRAAFLSAYSQQPYVQAMWSAAVPDAVRSEYTVESGGVAKPHALLSTVRAGKLYTLTATGGNASVGALHAANETVSAALVFLPQRSDSAFGGDEEAVRIPDPIENDGAVTPIELVNFTGVTTVDDTTVTIQSLPGAEMLLKTANDTLRGKADADGRISFTLSTRRVMVYTFTLNATAQDRAASKMTFDIHRRLTDEALEEAYRKSARSLDTIGYKAVSASPDKHTNTPLFFRGAAAAFTDLDGCPCVLFYTANPAPDVWENPVWVMLQTAVPLVEGDIRTVYGELLGDTLPYTDKDGNTSEAPLVICHSLVE